MLDLKNIDKSLWGRSLPESVRTWIKGIVNEYEKSQHEKKILADENERLKAEIRKLKSLPAKPTFSASDKTSDLDKEDKSKDEKDKKENPGKGVPRRKKHELAIDLTKQCEVNPDDLDSTFEYKGTRKVVVQDILFQRNNICFELEKYYSAEHGKTVEGNLPPGYDGGYFGPNVIAFILCSYYEGDVTIKKIWKILDAIEIKISIRQINRIINHQPDELVEELDEARVAGIEKAGYQQIDDTGALIGVQPVNAYSIVVCNPYFTNIVTSFSKSRFAAVMALAGGRKKPLYKLNDHAIFVFFSVIGKSMKIQWLLEKYKGEKVYTDDNLKELLQNDEFLKLSSYSRDQIRTAMLVGAFYDGHFGPTGKALVSDDAGQFNHIFLWHILCWYHELRHYKEILPTLEAHQVLMRDFFDEAKDLYKSLKNWIGGTRRSDAKDCLLKWFNDLFTTETGFDLLDERKRLTFKKIDKLLAPLFLKIEVPLQNNESERDIRGRVIKRKISLFNRTINGSRAWDLYISLKQTCRKLGVSYWSFLKDRITASGQVPQLAKIIQAI